MKVENLIEKFDEALSNLSLIEDIKNYGMVLKIDDEKDLQKAKFAYFLEDTIYHDDDICKVVDDLINSIEQVHYVNVEEFYQLLPSIEKVCSVLNGFGENKVRKGQLSFKVLLGKDAEGGYVVSDVRTASSQRRTLLNALEDIRIYDIDNKEEISQFEMANQKLNSLKVDVLNTLIYQKNYKEYEFFTGKDNLCLYNMVYNDFQSGKISNCVCKILHNPDCFVENYPKYQIKKLIKLKKAPLAYVEKLKNALKRKYGFLGKIEGLIGVIKSKEFNALAQQDQLQANSFIAVESTVDYSNIDKEINFAEIEILKGEIERDYQYNDEVEKLGYRDKTSE